MNTKYVEESDDARKYEYALKWKIHDTLSRLGSSENTFTQVYEEKQIMYAGLCIMYTLFH